MMTVRIRINAVCPAVIETAMGERSFGAPEVKKYAIGLHPLSRFWKTDGSCEGRFMDVFGARSLADSTSAR